MSSFSYNIYYQIYTSRYKTAAYKSTKCIVVTIILFEVLEKRNGSACFHSHTRSFFCTTKVKNLRPFLIQTLKY
jgi:hypothetical protein